MVGATRRRAVVLVAVIAAVIALPAPSAGAAPRSGTAGDASGAAREYLGGFAADHRVPGLAVGVVDQNGDVAFEQTTGRDGDGNRIDRDTPFLIGSVAKSMTATLVVQQVQRGAVRTTDHIGEHLPWLAEKWTTVEQLLTHTSGYTAADGLDVAERFDNAGGAIRRAAADLAHSGTTGRYAYSDANYLILGALVEQLARRPFAEVLRTDLLTPLGMVHSGASSDDAAHLPPGHRYWWGLPRTYAPGFDESGGPFGYVVSTLGDLERYARAQAGHTPRVLDPSLVQELHVPRVHAGDDDYGYGWRVSRAPAPQSVQHTGATPGYFAHVLVTPGGRSVVVLMNAYGEARAPALASVATNVARILDGQSVQAVTDDRALSSAPWIASAVALLGAGVVMVAWWRPRRRRYRITCAGIAVILCTAASSVPLLLGSGYRTVWIWAPDLSTALIGTVACWLVAAGVFVVRRTPHHRSVSIQ